MSISAAAASAIGAIGSSVTSSLGSLATGRMNYKNSMRYATNIRHWDREDAERDWRWAQEWRDNDRDYYSYKNDVARLKEAGLSPYLNYGNSSASPSAVSSSTPVSPGGAGSSPGLSNTYPSLDPRLSPTLFADLKVKDAQANDLNASADEKRGRTNDPEIYKEQQRLNRDLTKTKLVGQETQNRIAATDADIKAATKDNAIEASRLNTKKLESTIESISADLVLKADRHKLNEADYKLAVQKLAYYTVLTAASRKGIEMTESQIQLVQEQISAQILDNSGWTTEQDEKRSRTEANNATARYLRGKPAREWTNTAVSFVGSAAGIAAKLF